MLLHKKAKLIFSSLSGLFSNHIHYPLFNEVYVKIIESSKICSSDKPLSVDIYQKVNVKKLI